ncbi:MAG: DUF1015 domain-containing protein [Crocinitomicaceae bacterium]|nr:DUF1015 domain-containing protein [Crocinitomicaceae bacterium]
MAKIRPFKAIRPTRDKVHLVAARPYYSYKKNVLEAKLEDNPFTFLHIISPEFGLDKTDRPDQKERFGPVSDRYADFIARGILTQDDSAQFYIYRQTKNGHAFTGLIGAASIDEYRSDKIKKHEATITSREELFTDYLNQVGYNAEPVLLSYQGNERIDTLFENSINKRPEYEFTTTDLVTHELWTLSSDQSDQFQNAFESVPDLYIADGHHRSASSVRLQNLRSSNEVSFQNENSFLAYMIDERRLKIFEFNRLIKGLNGHTTEEILTLLEENYKISPLTEKSKPSREHQITMCIQGDWYSLECKQQILCSNHPVNSLDPQILTDTILDPILGVKDLKINKRVTFISGTQPLSKVERKIEEKEFDIGFILFPVTMDQVKRVADHQMIMPPKSTWVEPKMRSGLTIYNINE